MVPSSVHQRLDVLLDSLSDLRRYARDVDAARLAADRDAERMVLHALHTGAQAAIDLALHMSADREQPTSSTYQEAFARLAAAGLLEPGLAQRLRGWAGLRNVSAHQDATIDRERIVHALRHDLVDLERLGAIAGAWLQAHP